MTEPRDAGRTLTLSTELPAGVRFRILWAKEVDAVNLSVHCFHSLKGKPHHIEPAAAAQVFRVPDRARFLYVCGVTEPYVHRLNAHLLVTPDDTAGEQSVTVPGLSVTMTGLRQIPITDEAMNKELYANRSAYVTCRNLQAAWELHTQFGLENLATEAPKIRRSQMQAAELTRAPEFD